MSRWHYDGILDESRDLIIGGHNLIQCQNVVTVGNIAVFHTIAHIVEERIAAITASRHPIIVSKKQNGETMKDGENRVMDRGVQIQKNHPHLPIQGNQIFQ